MGSGLSGREGAEDQAETHDDSASSARLVFHTYSVNSVEVQLKPRLFDVGFGRPG